MQRRVGACDTPSGLFGGCAAKKHNCSAATSTREDGRHLCKWIKNETSSSPLSPAASKKQFASQCTSNDVSHREDTHSSPERFKMPQSRELANKKNDHKDRQSRGRANSTPTDTKKGGAGAHNWGITTEEESTLTALDRQDPNYDSSDEATEEGSS